jgi:hypothetical protein
VLQDIIKRLKYYLLFTVGRMKLLYLQVESSVPLSFFKCISRCPQLMVLVVHPTPRGYTDGIRVLDLDGARQRQYVTRRGYEIRQGRFHAYTQI